MSYRFGIDFHTSYSGPYLLTLDTIPSGSYYLHIMPQYEADYSVLVICEDVIEYACGDTITGILTASQPFTSRIVHIARENYVIFEFEVWSGITYTLYDIDNEEVIDVAYVNSLKGKYMLELQSLDDGENIAWSVYVQCVDESIITNASSQYVSIMMDESLSWLDAHKSCIKEYGTSLATIKTNQDILIANQIINTSIESNNLYIGLYKDVGMNETWKWLDGALWYDFPCLRIL